MVSLGTALRVVAKTSSSTVNKHPITLAAGRIVLPPLYRSPRFRVWIVGLIMSVSIGIVILMLIFVIALKMYKAHRQKIAQKVHSQNLDDEINVELNQLGE